MAHEVENMLFAGETPWHKIGQQITTEQSNDLEYLKRQPTIAWTAEKHPLFLADGRKASTCAVVRSSDKRIIGEVGANYTIVQNSDAVDWFAPFVQSGDASVECIGSLRQGSRVFVLARLNRDPIQVVKGDEVLPYLLVANSHDGTMGLHVGFTPVRVVCANTLQMARSDRRSKLLQLRHTKGVHLALETVQKTISIAHRDFVATAEQYRTLAQHGCTEATLRAFVAAVFDTREVLDTDSAANDVSARESRVYPEISRLFEEGMGANIPGVRGTLWGAVNAVSEYTQYFRGNSKTTTDARLNETWFGTGAEINRKALNVAIALAA
jgi:phage/plasmid-like protein (TIGR03299 family)